MRVGSEGATVNYGIEFFTQQQLLIMYGWTPCQTAPIMRVVDVPQQPVIRGGATLAPRSMKSSFEFISAPRAVPRDPGDPLHPLTGAFDMVFSVTEKTLNESLAKSYADPNSVAFPRNWSPQSLKMGESDQEKLFFDIKIGTPTVSISAMGSGKIDLTVPFVAGSVKWYSVDQSKKPWLVVEHNDDATGWSLSLTTDLGLKNIPLSDEMQKRTAPFVQNKFTVSSLFLDFTNAAAVVSTSIIRAPQASDPAFQERFRAILFALLARLREPDYLNRPFVFGVVATSQASDRSPWAPYACYYSTTHNLANKNNSTVNFLMTVGGAGDPQKVFAPLTIAADETIGAKLMISSKLVWMTCFPLNEKKP